MCLQLKLKEYVFTQPLHHEQDATQGQFLSFVQLIWIFPDRLLH